MQVKHGRKIIVAIFIIGFLLAFSMNIKCQEVEKVEVTKQFVQDATKAFDLVVSQRATIQKFLDERAASEAERKSAQALLAAIDDLIKLKDNIVAATEQLAKIYEKVIALQTQVYERVIEMQNRIIDNLEKRINKPKGFFDKVLTALKEIALFVSGVVIGRGLGF